MKSRQGFYRWIFTVFLLNSFLISSGQLYKSNVGLRFDDEQFGLSFDQKIAKPLTIQAFMDADKSELRYGLILRHHNKIAGRRLNWYQGLGAHGGMIKNQEDFYGFNLLVGAEYKFFLFPIVISFDVNPMFHVTDTHPDFINIQTVFSIKYILAKDNKIQILHPNRRESDPD